MNSTRKTRLINACIQRSARQQTQLIDGDLTFKTSREFDWAHLDEATGVMGDYVLEMRNDSHSFSSEA
ncbi:hypothetical protein JXA32_02880, partial [Candidatus Sumerlaeota bacterium]|nr:hypothetical protein [Candidatus Sumerlaeota bacterium]